MQHPHLSLKNNDRLVKYSKVEKLLLNSLKHDNKGNMEGVIDAVVFIQNEKEKIMQRGVK